MTAWSLDPILARKSLAGQPVAEQPGQVQHASRDLATGGRTSRFPGIYLSRFSLVIVFLLGLFIYTWRLADAPLDRTEPHRALVAHEMAQSGRWLLPRLFGEVYLRKPPLIYWVEAFSEKLLGANEFAWRFPSALGSALLAAILAGWAGRWFGRGAMLATGLACLSLVALWPQNRAADIDALHTVATTLTAVCVLELRFGSRFARTTLSLLAWTGGFSAAFSAMILLKGPAGLPVVLAALLSPPWQFTDRTHRTGRIIALISGCVIAVATFAVYTTLVTAELHRLCIPVDRAGLHEALAHLHAHSLAEIWESLITPVEVLAFAAPATLAIPFAIIWARRLSKVDCRRTRVTALLGTVGLAMLFWLIVGNTGVRYEYIMLPLLAVLVGAVTSGAVNGDFLPLEMHRLRQTFSFFVLVVAGAAVVMSIRLGLKSELSVAVIVAAGLSVVFAIIANYSAFHRRDLPAALSAALAILCFSLPMNQVKNAERRARGGRDIIAQLRELVGSGGTVSAASFVRDMPALLYYANVNVRAFGELNLPALARETGGHWVILAENSRFPEYSTLVRSIPGAFPRGVTRLAFPRDNVYVGWYDPPKNAETSIRWDAHTGADD